MGYDGYIYEPDLKYSPIENAFRLRGYCHYKGKRVEPQNTFDVTNGQYVNVDLDTYGRWLSRQWLPGEHIEDDRSESIYFSSSEKLHIHGWLTSIGTRLTSFNEDSDTNGEYFSIPVSKVKEAIDYCHTLVAKYFNIENIREELILASWNWTDDDTLLLTDEERNKLESLGLFYWVNNGNSWKKAVEKDVPLLYLEELWNVYCLFSGLLDGLESGTDYLIYEGDW